MSLVTSGQQAAEDFVTSGLRCALLILVRERAAAATVVPSSRRDDFGLPSLREFVMTRLLQQRYSYGTVLVRVLTR